MQRKGLIWFRNDLRVRDNSALAEAARQCSQLVALFIVQPEQWQMHQRSPLQIDYVRRHVLALQQRLAALNIPLVIKSAATFTEAPALVEALASSLQAERVFANRELPVNEQRRDEQTANYLAQRDKQLILLDDDCIVPPGEVRTGKGDPFKVFTPFKKAWLTVFNARDFLHCEAIPEPRQPWPEAEQLASQQAPVSWPTQVDSEHWPCGEQHALQQLRTFCQQPVTVYHQQRDLPAQSGTAKLSPWLAIGVLSARQCVARLCHEYGGCTTLPEGPATWLNELIWRDFYKHVMVAFPWVMQNQPFKREYRALDWSQEQGHFQAWCDGQTGYPIVDAAMRQLNQTGWMHNRLRMIVASFLSKDLLLDWRWGEAYFMSHLIDGELAANNGGWQWAASTGTDAAPYFRIFNPTRQSQRFDPEGEFIREWIPELASLSSKNIHEPGMAERNKLGYPAPLVDHSEQRKKALALFAHSP